MLHYVYHFCTDFCLLLEYTLSHGEIYANYGSKLTLCLMVSSVTVVITAVCMVGLL